MVMAPAASQITLTGLAEMGAVTAALEDGAELRGRRGDQATADRYRMLADSLRGVS